MVAGKAARVWASCAQGADPLDNAGRIRPAIDQIAEEDEPGGGGATRSVVRSDLFQQPIEKIEPAMNIADGIDAAPLGQSRLDRFGTAAREQT